MLRDNWLLFFLLLHFFITFFIWLPYMYYIFNFNQFQTKLYYINRRIDMNFTDGVRSVCPKTFAVLEIIGALIILRKIITLFSRIYKLLRKRKDLKKRYGNNSWAFITGSSEEGIGRALAISLAKQGFNIIISARTANKLQQVKKTINEKYPDRQVQILVADYKKGINWDYIQGLLNQISNLDISIVVNNVGVDVLDKYVDLQPQKIQDLISLNCYPLSFINRYFLPIFEKRTKQTGKKCAIVNISSIAGTIPMSYFQVYCASKAYVDRLSLSLAYEHPSIDLISIRPSQVSTPMTCNKQTDIFTIKADECAQGILNQLGYEKMSYGHWRHQLQGWLYEIVPHDTFNYIFQKIFLPSELQRRKENEKKMQEKKNN